MTVSPLDILRRDLDKTQQRADAIHELESLLVDFATAEIPEDGSYTYDDSTGLAEQYMIGSGSWAVFVEFRDEAPSGYLEYADSDGTTMVPIPDLYVKELRSVLRRDAKARNAR